MADSYLGEIRMFAGTFAPSMWAFCDGQLMTIAQNSALYSLLGSTYGGDGRTSFGLPEMRGRIPVHQGAGPGLSTFSIGMKYGSEAVTILTDQMPNHTHAFQASGDSASSSSPAGMVLGSVEQPDTLYTDDSSAGLPGQMKWNSVYNTGASQPHDNLMGYQCLNFILSLAGIYPSRN